MDMFLMRKITPLAIGPCDSQRIAKHFEAVHKQITKQFEVVSGLLDCFWYNIPQQEKYSKRP
jgi:hypothetical protein